MSFWSSSYYYALIPVGAITFIYLVRKIREFQWGWVRNTSSLRGKIYIVTGANTGLGFETTKALVKRDATVILACRDRERASSAISKIRQSTGCGEMVFSPLDLSSFQSIREFVSMIQSEYPNFDCLINNAGLAVQSEQYTKDGYELHFGVNHLGHFYLFYLLEENITKNNSRIVIVSSSLHQKGVIDFKNLGKYTNPVGAAVNHYYNNSKLANFYFARELHKRKYDAYVLCPGLCKTDFFRDYNPKWYHYILFAPVIWLLLRSAEQGAQNIILCATENVNTDTKNPGAGYFIKSLKQTKSKVKFSDETSERLWNKSLQMCTL